MQHVMVQTGNAPHMFEHLQQYFKSGATLSYDFRKAQLQQLRKAIQANEAAILQALYKDLHKSAEEAYTTEVGFIYGEISHALQQLKRWMEPATVNSPLLLFPSSSKIVRDALGVTLIIAPWNYPFHLLMAPLIGAIAGGNCAVLKPSELAVHTSMVIKKIITENFSPNYLQVVEGNGAQVVPALMNAHRFDHVFFTGSVPVGRQVAMLAASKLVPVTLELGGKSPCIVDKDADIKVAAQRITWGKFTNAGQTCVAPDYLLVHNTKKQELVEEIRQAITRFYGTDAQQSPDYGRIINDNRFNTLQGYLQQGDIIMGGQTDAAERFISPTLMQNVGTQQPIMQEEIFGPILPVFTFNEHEEALHMISNHANPLALYLFTGNADTERMYVEQVHFGGGCINNTLLHLANAALPFGGVGNSGMGAYHGKFSFDTFTRPKPVVKTATWMDPAQKYPPYKGRMPILKWLMK